MRFVAGRGAVAELLLAGALSGRNLLAKAHKNLDFVLGRSAESGTLPHRP